MEPILKEKPEYDMLRLYFGDDFRVTDRILVHQPTIGEILNFGEQRVYSAIAPLIYNPTTFRVQLWDAGVDWNKIEDYDLFCSMIGGMRVEETSLFFGDFDFAALKPYRVIDTGEIVYMDDELHPVIDKSVYDCLSDYLRTMMNIHPKVEKAKGKTTKKWIIEEEKQNQAIKEKNGEDKFSSFLLPLVSGCLNNPGFKYKKNELREVGIVEFMDCVQRLQVYENSRALMGGMYSGFVDIKKIPNFNQQINWLRDLYSKAA